MSDLFSYRAIVRAAFVAALFSIVVCALLVWDYTRRTPDLPLDSPQYIQLRQTLDEEPETTPAEALRELDAQLRARYFQQKAFTRRGALLLVGGLALTLLLAHAAATVRRRLPSAPVVTPSAAASSGQSQLAQWTVAGLGAVLLLGAGLAPWLSPSLLPARVDRSPSVAAADPSAVDPSSDGMAEPAPEPAVVPPTPEQILANWPRFRGPSGSGVSTLRDVPTEWDAASGTGVLWKSAVPMPGVSSPIVWQQHVFLTGATSERREVYCFDATDGHLRWQREVAPAAPESVAAEGEETELEVSEDTGYAAPTPATDGQRVYAMFANGDVAAFDFEGEQVWAQNLGTPNNLYGHAASLTTYQNQVIIQFDQGTEDDDLSRLIAINGATGEILWHVPRKVPASWASPIVVEYQGEPRIITAAAPWVIAYSPEDGRELWRADCLKGDVGPSPAYADGLVFVANDGADAVAIRDGGDGDVTETHVLWQYDVGMPDICSPLPTEKYLLIIASYGELVCYDRMKGDEPIWEEDFGSMFGASPAIAGERVYLINDEGNGWVLTLSAEGCQRIAENSLGERCVTSPAFLSGRIFLRGEEHLFCLGSTPAESTE